MMTGKLAGLTKIDLLCQNHLPKADDFDVL